MENDEKYVHGHLDPGIESTLELIKGVESLDTSTFSSSLEAPSSESSYGKIALSPGMSLLCCIVFLACLLICTPSLDGNDKIFQLSVLSNYRIDFRKAHN